MVSCAVDKPGSPLLFLLFITTTALPGMVSSLSTVKELSVLEGGAATIPCHYDHQYIHHVKYWCRGSVKDWCAVLARTDSTPADSRVSVYDDPSQLVFTVNMKDLSEQNSAWYWCGVELGGIWKADDMVPLYIAVTHGITVEQQMVSGYEGDTINIDCHYSNKHRESVKKWCRSGNWNSCLTLNQLGMVGNGSVSITDEGNGVFTATMRELKMQDSGWYLFVADQHQVSVHIEVLRMPTATMSLLISMPLVPGEMEANNALSQRHNTWEPVLMAAGVVLFLAVVVTIVWRMCVRYMKPHREELVERVASLMKEKERDPNMTFTNDHAQQEYVV